MAKIKFVKNYPDIEALEGAILMEALLQAEMPVASSCHGDGICGKCQIIVVEGHENLSPRNPRENELVDKFQVSNDRRISCQTQIKGDILVDTTYW